MNINKIIASVVTIVLAIVATGVIAKQVKLSSTEKVREEVVTFNVLSETYEPNVYDNILYFSQIDLDQFDIVTNVEIIKINDLDVTDDFGLYILDDFFRLGNNDTGSQTIFYIGGTWLDQNDDGDIVNGDIISITFEVTQASVISGVTAILLSLLPLIFAGAVITFIYTRKDLSL